MEFEELKEDDLDNEEITLNIKEKAFEHPAMCVRCKKKMKEIQTDFELPGGELTLHLAASKCLSCGKETLTMKQAEKLQEMLLLIDAVKDKSRLKFERSINHDGKSFFIRFPKEITENWKKNMITEIMPINNNQIIIHVHSKSA